MLAGVWPIICVHCCLILRCSSFQLIIIPTFRTSFVRITTIFITPKPTSSQILARIASNFTQIFLIYNSFRSLHLKNTLQFSKSTHISRIQRVILPFGSVKTFGSNTERVTSGVKRFQKKMTLPTWALAAQWSHVPAVNGRQGHRHISKQHRKSQAEFG